MSGTRMLDTRRVFQLQLSCTLEMSYVRPSRLDLCDDFFVRERRHLSPEIKQTSKTFPAASQTTTRRIAPFSSPRGWRGDEPIFPPQEYRFQFLPSRTSPCRSTTTNIVEILSSRKESPRHKISGNLISVKSPRRVPNEKQLPRWLRQEDAQWNPPTYIPQLTPGALPHFALESDLLRTPRSVSRHWQSMSAIPQRLPRGL
jgi:hypothetical protein